MEKSGQQWSAPAAAPAPMAKSGPSGSQPVFKTPVWCTVVRGFQLLIALVIMVMAGLLMHGLVLDAIAYSLVCGLFTFIVVIYVLVSEKAQGAHKAYNYWAVIALDAFMTLLWLAAMGAVAALRGTFKYTVNGADCWNDGSTFNSNHCVTWKRGDPAAVAGSVALAEMSAIAGLSALEMLLFIATLVWLAHSVRLHRASKTNHSADGGVVEMKAQSQPMLDPNAPSLAQNNHPQYSASLQYGAPQGYQQQQPQQYSQPQQYPQAQQYPHPQAHEAPAYTPSHTPAPQYPQQGQTPVSPMPVEQQPYQQYPAQAYQQHPQQ